MTRALPRIITALSPEEQFEAALRARRRSEERKRKRDAFMLPPADELPQGWRWHVVQSEGRRELLAAEEIDKLEGFKPWVPSYEREIVDRRSPSRARRSEIVRRVVFPCYLFVAFAPGAPWAGMAHAKGVAGMVMAGTRPEPVPDPQIARVLYEARYNFGLPIKRESKFEPGDEVRATDGPFFGFEGEVESVNSSLQIVWLMSLFGRKVRMTSTEEMLELVS
jgi:transcription antitermination factor NusG